MAVKRSNLRFIYVCLCMPVGSYSVESDPADIREVHSAVESMKFLPLSFCWVMDYQCVLFFLMMGMPRHMKTALGL